MDKQKKIEFLKQNIKKSVVFVGLMGGGKSSVGLALAQSLDINFVDSDHLIEEEEGYTIAELFEKSGESYFRERERETLQKLAQSPEVKIIGTGGGAFMNQKTQQAILDLTTSIFLKADLDVLCKRLGNCEGRPLLKGGNPEQILKGLIHERYPIYEKAELSVVTNDERLEETLDRVIETLYTHLSQG